MRRDDDAFAGLVRPHVDRLYRTAILLTGGDHQRSEDLVQAALVRLYARRGWHRLEHPGAYLRRILVNEHISSGRRRSSTEIPVGVLPETGAAAWESSSATHLDLFRALSQLSLTDRTVVVLRYWDDLSVADTAATTGLSAGAVRNRSARALTALRSALDGYNPVAANTSDPVVGLPQGRTR